MPTARSPECSGLRWVLWMLESLESETELPILVQFELSVASLIRYQILLSSVCL